jgi:hypothetical protein
MMRALFRPADQRTALAIGGLVMVICLAGYVVGLDDELPAWAYGAVATAIATAVVMVAKRLMQH